MLLRAQEEEVGHRYSAGTCYNAVVRTIWDGDQILWEIAAPGGSLSEHMEDDDYRQAFGGPYFYGRVQYTNAGGIDMPVVLTRIGYSEPLERPITIWPLTNWAGRFDSREVVNGCVTVTIPGASGGTFAPYVPAPGKPGYDDDYHEIRHCVDPNWPGKQLWSSLRPKPGSPPRGWVGSLTQHGRDPSGQYYRRNRYYDPVSGQFTQEDPIGLAGGLNLYGYAGGDPINFWDPFGLCRQIWRKRCRQRTSAITMGDVFLHGGLGVVALSGNNRYATRAQFVLAATAQVRADASELVGARVNEDRVFWDQDRLNAFRHIYGSCQLTRMVGPTTAAVVTNAHETALRTGDEAQERDSRADRQNNSTGIAAAEAPANANSSCESLADRHVYGGSMPRATSRATGLILLLISLASCSEGEGPAVIAVDDYLLPQAAGVQLGMSWRELRSVRPGVRNKDGIVYENSPEGRNIYLFRRQDEAPKLGSTKGHVAAVLMYPPPGLGEEDLGRRVDLIREQWSTRIGPPRDSTVRVAGDGERKRSYQVLTWSHGDVHLRLEYEILPLQQQRARGRGMLATVEEADLPDLDLTR